MKKVILVIDNDLYISDLFATTDEADNFSVIMKNNGISGLEYISENYDKIGVIILSVELPDKNGFIICKSLKEKTFLNNIPLVLISRANSAETFEKHSKLKTRADVYLTKPLDKSAIFFFLSRAVEDPAPFLINPVIEKFPDWVFKNNALSSALEKKTGFQESDSLELLKDIETIRNLLNKIEKKIKAQVK